MAASWAREIMFVLFQTGYGVDLGGRRIIKKYLRSQF
eukprot:COSAG06_NODE_57212_length_281_cov_0.829670_1_plen_36_part_10